MQQRLPSLLDPPITFAHRGARAHAPENTIEAFELALRLGATGLESDVWLTVDGVPVLDHDGVIRTKMRRRPIGELRRDELPTWIPSVADLIAECGADFELSLDLKDPDAAVPTIDVLRAHDPEFPRRVWLCDPDVDRLVALRPVLPEVRLVNSVRLERISEGPERRAARLAAEGVDGSTCTARTGAAGWSRCSTGSSGSRSAGTSSTSTICARGSGWGSTRSTATVSM